MFACCPLARNVFGGIQNVSQVHQGASTDIIMERRDEIREFLWQQNPMIRRKNKMKKKILFSLIVLALMALPVCIACTLVTSTTQPTPPTQGIAPVVSTDWLAMNMDAIPNLVILDTRAPDNYAKGHIPGSINVPGLGNFYLCLFAPDCGLWMELPEDSALLRTIGNAGITADSLVVVVGRTVDPFAPYAVADAARAAITLVYAGVDNVALLNGGYDKWASEKKPISRRSVKPKAVTYSGAVNKAMFVTKDYVEQKIGKATLVEARECIIYFGIVQEPWTVRAGHIPTAKNLPSPWFWEFAKNKKGVITYGTWKDADVIKEMALTVLGDDASEEIIVYCGVGGYASPMWFALTQIVGYTNVKLYDGSMQEWTADPEAPVVKYRYQ
jgi:thiosulfate/3-mercaptopyruvate sulfurtransferase